jgi:hypothetical protein
MRLVMLMLGALCGHRSRGVARGPINFRLTITYVP